ncbi:MAG: hypothetical protein AAGB26_08320 [Planctomycetota bacterium]
MSASQPKSPPDLNIQVVKANFEAVEQIDKGLVTSAIDKLETGGQPSAREMEALRRAVRTCGQVDRNRHYRAIPIGEYASMTGLTMNEIKQQADLYGLPLHGETVDLGKLLPRFYDLLEARDSRGG